MTLSTYCITASQTPPLKLCVKVCKHHASTLYDLDSVIRHLINEGVSTLDVCFYTGTNLSDGRPETTTILNELLLTRNEGNFAEDTWNENKGCIEYFLEKGADINFVNVSCSIFENLM